MNWQLVFTENNLRRLLIGDWPRELGGVALTVELSLIGMVGATLLGFLVGYLRFAGPRPVRWLAGGYVELIQGPPVGARVLQGAAVFVLPGDLVNPTPTQAGGQPGAH